MRARTFQRAVTMDEADVLEQIVRLLESQSVAYCVIGGQGVNAYVEPLVSLDLDIVVAASDLDRVLAALPDGARIERFPPSVNMSMPGSNLRVQFQTDPRCGAFPERAQMQEVLGLRMKVAAVEDVLAGKIWAASDATRRTSKRLKDLTDIARLLEQYPNLRTDVPPAILEKITLR
jgi:hypothetical protein